MKLREKLMRLLRQNKYKRTLKIDKSLEHQNVYVYTKRVSDIDVSAMIFNLLYDYDCYTVKLGFLLPGKHYNMIWIDKPEVLEEALSILNSVNKFIEEENEKINRNRLNKTPLKMRKSKESVKTGTKRKTRMKTKMMEKIKNDATKC